MGIRRPIGYRANLVSLRQAARFWREGPAGFAPDLGTDKFERINRLILGLRTDDIATPHVARMGTANSPNREARMLR